MASLIRAKSWEVTALGPIVGWSAELTAALNMMLSAPVPMLVFWGSELSMFYNDAGIAIASTNHPAALGQSARKVFEEAWHLVGPQLETVMRNGASTFRQELLVPLQRNGVLQDLWWNYSYSALYEREEIAGVLVICQDVTASVLARQERATVTDRLNQVLDATTDSITTIDRNWRITYLNPAAKRTAGPITDVVGKNLWEAFPATVLDGSPYLENLTRAMDGGVACDFEAFYPEPLEVWLRVQAQPAKDGIVLFVRDVTEHRRSTAALMETEKLAAVGRLASTIAHEINNPLEALTNLLYLVGSSTSLDEARPFLESADGELRRASTITNQALRFHKQSTRPIASTFRHLTTDLFVGRHSRLKNANARVELRDRSTDPVLCFEGEIHQVLNNLIGNAIDAMLSTAAHCFYEEETVMIGAQADPVW